MSNEEIAAAYRRAIEVLWKFLKTHLKLDKMMSKNLHRITIQIYAILIVYLLLQCLRHGYAYRNSPHIWESMSRQVEIYIAKQAKVGI